MKKGAFAFMCIAVLVAGVALFVGGAGASSEGGFQAGLAGAGRSASVLAESPLDVGLANGSSEPGDRGEWDASGAARESEQSSDPEYVQDAIIVGLRDDASASDLNGRLASLDYIATKEVTDEDISLGYVSLALAEGVSVDDAEARIVEEDVVTAVQPNYVYRLADGQVGPRSLITGIIAQAEAVNDARVSEQWALEAVNAFEAWEIAKTERAVTVAVIDNGCLTTHEDLKNNIVAQYDVITGTESVTAKNGQHGTHVCGIVAAEANNGVGVAGVSYNAGLLPINVFTGSTAETAELLKAYDFVLEHADDYNIKVANMSIGAAVDVDSVDDEALGEEDVALETVVRKAYDRGILTVCAAGNDANVGGAYMNYPSDWLDCALGVIASNKYGKRASYSNYNKEGQTTKDIMAPGGESKTGGEQILSSVLNGYGYLYGTSMATPCVSGIAALMFAANPNLTAGEVAALLCSTAQDANPSANLNPNSSFDLETGYGLVDARAAVEAAEAAKGQTRVPASIAQAELSLSATSYTYNGVARKPEATVKLDGVMLARDEDYTVEYSGNTDAGTATVTVTGVESRGYVGVKTATFTIKPAKLADMTLSLASCAFDGKAKSPKVTVTGPRGGKGGQTLTAGTDYTLITPSGRKNAGTYTYEAVAKGPNYTGTLSKQLTIKKAVVSSVALSTASFTYSGAAKKPSVSVKGSNGLALRPGSDYTVSYKGNTAVGKASVTVTGKGNYSGQKSATFTISKRTNTMKASASIKTVKALALKKAKRSVAPITVKNARGQVTFKKTGGSKLLTVGKGSGKVTIAKGAKRGTYRANVKVSAAGTSTYKALSKVVKVEVRVL